MSARVAQVRGVLAEHARWVDDLSPHDAEVVGRGAAREWYAETGRCPWCGIAGEFHGEAQS